MSALQIMAQIVPDLGKLRSELATGVPGAMSGATAGIGAAGETAGASFASRMTGHIKTIAAGMATMFAVNEAKKFGSESVDAFKQVASESNGLRRVIGGNVEDASRLRFAFSQVGLTTDQITVPMKKFEQGLATNSKAVKSLGIDTRDAHGNLLPMAQILPEVADKFAKMPDGIEKSALATQLFGKQGLAMIPFLNKGSAGIKDLMAQSDKMGMTIGGSGVDAMVKSVAAQRQWQAAMNGLKVAIGGALLPIMTSLATTIQSRLIPGIVAASGFISAHGAAITKTALAAIGFVAPLLAIVGGAKKAMDTFSVLGNVFKGITSIFSLNPFALIVVGIVAFVAALVIAYQRSETFRNIVNQAFAVLRDVVWPAIQQAVQAIQNFVVGLLNGSQNVGTFGNLIRTIFTQIWQIIQQVMSIVVTVITVAIGVILAAWNAWGAQIMALAQAAWSGITSIIQAALTLISSIFTVVLDLLHGNWSKAWQDMGRVLVAAWDLIKATISAALSVIVAALQLAWSVIRSAAEAAWSGIKALISAAWEGIKSGISAAASAITSLLSAAWSGIRSAASAAWEGIKSLISSAWSAITSAVTAGAAAVGSAISSGWNAARSATSSAWSAIQSAVSSGIGAMMGLVSSIPGRITGALSGLGGLLEGAGRALMQGLINGITAMLGPIGSAMGAVAGVIKSHLPGSPVETGPLVSWNNGGAGKRLAGLLISGLESSRADVGRAAAYMVGGIGDPLASAGGVAAGAAVASRTSMVAGSDGGTFYLIDRDGALLGKMHAVARESAGAVITQAAQVGSWRA